MKKNYHTEQKRLLLEFLKNNPEKQYTIPEIADALSNASVGKSTLYRLINNLCNDGLVLRISKDNSRSYTYQFLGDGDCRSHMHLKCLDCGTLIHLDNSFSNHIHGDILDSCNFAVDEHQTMIVGRCKSCVLSKEAVK